MEKEKVEGVSSPPSSISARSYTQSAGMLERGGGRRVEVEGGEVGTGGGG